MITKEEKTYLTSEELALVLGCEVEIIKKLGADSNKVGERKTLNYEFFRTICAWSAFDYIKPILRPLSDMTEEENKWVEDYCENAGTSAPSFKEMADVTKYMLSKHIDIFGWIKQGLAIDKTKINS